MAKLPLATVQLASWHHQLYSLSTSYHMMILPHSSSKYTLCDGCIYHILHWFWNVNEIYALVTVRICHYIIP